MATALNVIEGALRMLNILSVGVSASTAQQTEGLDMLNLMIDEWRNEQLMCPWVVEESFALTSGDGEYSIGPGADFNTVRPIELQDSAFVRVSDIDYPITLINQAQYNAFPSKNVTGSFPQVLYYEPIFPQGIIRLWPLPGSGNTLYISSLKQLATMPGTGTTVSVPPGYELCYRSNLALTWSNNFGVAIPPGVVRTALRTKRSIRRVNNRLGVLGIDAAITTRFPSSGWVYGDIT